LTEKYATAVVFMRRRRSGRKEVVVMKLKRKQGKRYQLQLGVRHIAWLEYQNADDAGEHVEWYRELTVVTTDNKRLTLTLCADKESKLRFRRIRPKTTVDGWLEPKVYEG
jgi:hypothetical protein